MRSPEQMTEAARIAELERDQHAARMELDRLRFIEANARGRVTAWRKDAANSPTGASLDYDRALRLCAEEVEEILAAAGPPSDYEPTLATRLGGYTQRLYAEATAASGSGGEFEREGRNQDAGRMFARATALRGVARHLEGLLATREEDGPPTLESALAQVEQAAVTVRAIQTAMVKAGQA